eukprot:Cvel_36309.t1-p1 / transcript=Cvel_36309.t1 / gene=Cvel_36309 / organism=Chromera_velia_CCMP2878 / gene_product=hypothetical protein / transcript_product=hypothetical protein / location=Cvel_scaffold7122:1-900(-) / protein_length=241 / sequence_SO=supercontig / SO=protein_coding / is_pseudo=false
MTTAVAAAELAAKAPDRPRAANCDVMFLVESQGEGGFGFVSSLSKSRKGAWFCVETSDTLLPSSSRSGWGDILRLVRASTALGNAQNNEDEREEQKETDEFSFLLAFNALSCARSTRQAPIPSPDVSCTGHGEGLELLEGPGDRHRTALDRLRRWRGGTSDHPWIEVPGLSCEHGHESGKGGRLLSGVVSGGVLLFDLLYWLEKSVGGRAVRNFLRGDNPHVIVVNDGRGLGRGRGGGDGG